MSHLVLSMMPGKLLALVELFGYKGDRKFGLELLERAGGWGANGRVVEKGEWSRSLIMFWYCELGARSTNMLAYRSRRSPTCNLRYVATHLPPRPLGVHV